MAQQLVKSLHFLLIIGIATCSKHGDHDSHHVVQHTNEFELPDSSPDLSFTATPDSINTGFINRTEEIEILCQYTAVTECKQPLDIQFLLDSSGSVGSVNYQIQLNFTKNLVNAFEISPKDVRIGVTIFSFSVSNQFFLNTFKTKSEILDAIDNIPFLGSTTNTGDALEFIRLQAFTNANGDRPGVPNVLIVTTDGQSSSLSQVMNEAALIKDLGINVYAIGVGNGVNTAEINAIASDPSNVYTVTDFNALDDIREGLLNSTCQEAVQEQMVQLIRLGRKCPYKESVVLASLDKEFSANVNISSELPDYANVTADLSLSGVEAPFMSIVMTEPRKEDACLYICHVIIRDGKKETDLWSYLPVAHTGATKQDIVDRILYLEEKVDDMMINMKPKNRNRQKP